MTCVPPPPPPPFGSRERGTLACERGIYFVVSKLDRGYTQKDYRLIKKDNLLTEEGGKEAGVEPCHTNARKPGPL